MSKYTSSTLGTMAALLLLGAGPPDVARAPATGAVEGTVSVEIPPPRRSARRYPGGAAPAHAIQPIPVLVWVKGAVAGAPARPPSTAPEMMQRDTAFVPSALVVPVGTTVRFPNGDGFFHNVFSYSSGARFDLGRYPQGESKEVTFEEAGVVKVYCEVHEFMRAAIVVTQNPFSAVVGADGRFRIEGLPAGEHTLVVWHADLGEVEKTVRVTDGGVATLEVELR